MKLLIAALGVLVLACGKQEGIYDKLSAEDKLYVMERATEQCKEDIVPHFKAFSESSALALTKFSRGQYWEISRKSKASTLTWKIAVWNRREGATYFLEDKKENAVQTFNFIKLTDKQNLEMIAYIQKVKCDKKFVGSSSTSQLTVEVPPEPLLALPGSEYTETYTASFNLPAFFMNYSKVQKEVNVDDKGARAEGDTSTWTMTGKDTLDVFRASHTLYEPGRTKFCTVKGNEQGIYPFPPFELECLPATIDFDPAKELVI